MRTNQHLYDHLILILVILFLFGCQGLDSKLTHFNKENFEILSVQNLWKEAVIVAEDWSSEAYCTHASVNIPLPNSERGVRASAVYNFQTTEDDMVSLTVGCSGVSCKMKETQHTPQYPVSFNEPINYDDFSITSEQAFETGVREGGIKYIYNKDAVAFLILQRDFKDYSGPVVWIVDFIQYKPNNFPEEIRVKIDANTGEVLEIVK